MKLVKILVAALGMMTLRPAAARAHERFACALHALSGSERARHRALTAELFAAGVERRELADGYTFRLASRALSDVAEWIGFERRCCPFFTFDLEIARDGGPLSLAIRGSDGVKEFIRAEFGG